MQVILHGGAHHTDDDRLLRCLLRNIDALRERAAAVPGPGRYRTLLSDVANAVQDTGPEPGAREVLLDAILDEDPDSVDRLFLSHPNYFSVPKLALEGGLLYRKAVPRLTLLQELFETDSVELYMGLRDPATFLPALLRTTPHDSFDSLLHGADPLEIRWSELIARICDALPDLTITVWCNEDTPLIWGSLVRAAAGLPEGRKIVGAFDVLAELVEPEGMVRLRAFLKDNPHVNESQKRRVMAALLDKYARPDAMEEELDIPGWDAAYVDALSARYDEDMARLEAMPRVRFIKP